MKSISESKRIYKFLPVALSAFIGMMISALFVAIISSNNRNLSQSKFNGRATKLTSTLKHHITKSMAAIYHLSSYYKSSKQFSKEEFKEYVGGVINMYSEIQALEWVPRISLAERKIHEKQQSLYYPGYSITEKSPDGVLIRAKKRRYYYPVSYIYPLKGNESALGYDLASNPTRRSMIDYATQFNTIAMSNRIRLVQEKADSFGVLMALPILKKEINQKRTDNSPVHGVTIGVFRINTMIQKIINYTEIKDIELTVKEWSSDRKSVVLYHQPMNNPAEDNFVLSRKINIANQTWLVEIKGNPELYGADSPLDQIVLLITGFCFTALISGYIHLIRGSHQQADRMSSKLADEITIRAKYEEMLFKSYQKLEAITREDPLTGIFNRRAFNDYLQSEWDRARRSGQALSLIIIDIDNFKAYNDSYGHVMGDSCLTKVANCIASKANRPSDLTARYGGEEIAVVLPETCEEGAVSVAECIRQSILSLAIPHKKSDNHRFVSASIGVTTVEKASDFTPEEIIQLADKALYIAKNNGKNKVIFQMAGVSSTMTGMPKTL